MTKRIIALFITMIMTFSIVGCQKSDEQQSSAETEIIVQQEETIIEGENGMTHENSSTIQGNEDVNSTISSETPTTSVESPVTSVPDEPDEPDDTNNTDYEWKSHPQDYKLIALTFDDGPSTNMSRLVQLFSYYDGAGTFFVNGRGITSDSQYQWMQNAINYGWAIGNHGDNHLVATIGGTGGGEATYDEIKADIDNLTHKLEGNLKNADGTPYRVNLYRPPNIKPTANTFKICGENNLAVIWLAHDALDWDTSKTYQHRYNVFKDGIGTWADGDIILCHEVGVVGTEDTYKILEELLPDFYRAGYRFCSIDDLMKYRGISINQVSGELNDVDGNRGMVTNVLDAAKAGKK